MLFAVLFWKTTLGENLSSGLRPLRCAIQVMLAKRLSPYTQHISKLVEAQNLVCHHSKADVSRFPYA